MLLQKLADAKLVNPPKWLPENTFYTCMMGSHAYGCWTAESDYDYYGFCIPSQQMVFPHLAGEIPGFGNQIKRFEQWGESSKANNDYAASDWSIYSIVKYFQLVMENNPNMLNSLFVPRECIIHSTAISELVRENRHIFLSKKAWHTHKGYAYAQIHKMKGKDYTNAKRAKDIELWGYSTKFAYHVVRLLLEVEQLLTVGDVDLQLHRETYKAIRRGEWSQEKVEQFFAQKEKDLEKHYNESTALPYAPNQDKIKDLLLKCLEMHYGNIDNCVKILGREALAIQKIKEIVNEL